MPMRVRTPEDIFRIEKKDLYVIHGARKKGAFGLPVDAGKEGMEGVEMIRLWIEAHLPGTQMELIGPSEHLGLILGGIGDKLRVDFSEDGLKQFSAVWEDEQGISIDKRFQCYLYSYEKWYEAHGRFVPTREAPEKAGLTVWWYTPKGFIHHQLGDEEARSCKSHPAHSRDIWMHVRELWPDIASSDPDSLTHGQIGISGEGAWVATYNMPLPFSGVEPFDVPSKDQIRTWFKLPNEAEVFGDDF